VNANIHEELLPTNICLDPLIQFLILPS